MSDALNAIVEKLSVIPDLSGLGEVIEAIRSTYDVDHVYYYALSLGLDAPVFVETRGGGMSHDAGIWRRDGRSLGALSYSPEWITHYFDSQYEVIDPVLQGAAGAFAPIDWSDLDWGSAPRKKFLQDAGDFGVGNQGLTVPIRGPNGQFALFTINKACAPSTWAKLMASYRTDFTLIAHYTHQQALKLSVPPPDAQSRPLSAREMDAIRLIADGLSRGRAADKLGISENTFRVYIDSARHKLGALNIPHAIALAAYRGVITPQ